MNSTPNHQDPPLHGPLVLIEPYAYRLGGHHQHALLALAQACPGTLVIAPNGIAQQTAAGLRDTEAQLVTGASGPYACLLLRISGLLARLSWIAQRVFRSHRWPHAVRRSPHQITLIAQCLVEAAALRTARRHGTGAGTVVILSGSEALHGAAALLGGLPHLRFIHEVLTTEDPPLHLLGRLTRGGERRVVALCPTTAVRDQVDRLFPGLASVVRAFAVDDGCRLTDGERHGGRAAFAIPPAEAAVCLVGGWWPHKDIGVIGAALGRLKEPLHLIVAGHPLDDTVLARWQALPNVHLHTEPGPLSEPVLRLVYAAADAALVARHSGVGKESGLVMDTARYGVPLIVSDHDPDLSQRLRDQSWARIFPAGDAASLARVLEDLVRQPFDMPGPEAPKVLDLRSAAEQARYLTQSALGLRGKGAGC
ncbi:hypothetical protein OG883_15290 [Streptomyces sp. NBC_01142]|uniref:hypothetical protein n=1 Tax=Streptomyces sp. NBC_01142 TaxID=2975865 RepID=UPI002257677E|nr:hypothetical protein [Streptomyces sp. NBC_01142]MCX4821250.1 hypothetical protein [Streptomyces sp. NBC_01142]